LKNAKILQMNITEVVWKYAAKQGIAEEEALKKGMEEGEAKLIRSSIHDLENGRNPFTLRRRWVQ